VLDPFCGCGTTPGVQSTSRPPDASRRALGRRTRLALSADGHEVTLEEPQLESAEVPTTLIEELEQAERRRVGEALAQARGSRTDAAWILGMPRTTLINKLRRYGLK
jgi:DNA-binding NtrC family response regulator